MPLSHLSQTEVSSNWQGMIRSQAQMFLSDFVSVTVMTRTATAAKAAILASAVAMSHAHARSRGARAFRRPPEGGRATQPGVYATCVRAVDCWRLEDGFYAITDMRRIWARHNGTSSLYRVERYVRGVLV